MMIHCWGIKSHHFDQVENMKSFTEYLWFNTTQEEEFINITDELKRLLRESKIAEGMMLVSAMHITAGVYVNDDESGLIEDIKEWLKKLAPENPAYRHHQTGETNGHAHLRNLIIHHQVILPITKGELDLGRWQQVFYAEFDGRRKKRVIVKIMGE
jgi:secondary thiamine-phosphate synthase enzyme